MNIYSAEILTELFARTCELIEADPPRGGRAWFRTKTELEHGPEYSATRWFGANAPAIAMRYARALRELEADGLVELWREWGTKISHVKLTIEGERVAELLAKQAERSEST